MHGQTLALTPQGNRFVRIDDASLRGMVRTLHSRFGRAFQK